MRKMIEMILKVLGVVLLVAWIVIVFIDWKRTTDGKYPYFCIKPQTKVYDDGTTFVCNGLGYKMYRYNRTFGGYDFGPFFIKEKTSAE